MTDRSSVKLVSVTQTDPAFIDELRYQINSDDTLSDEERRAFTQAIKTPEGLIAYTARVSSPKQANPKFAGLLKYCLDHQHWSVFEMVDMTLEIQTSRAIAQQILRHRSFSFQEFSQRYAAVPHDAVIYYEARRQDQKNRQNSTDDMCEDDKKWFVSAQEFIWAAARVAYDDALKKGIAKECARFLLPLNTKTKLYMKGSLRSWIHYIGLRSGHGTQKEHMEIACKARDIFCKQFPIISEALGWNEVQSKEG